MTRKDDKNFEMARRIAAKVAEAGGRSFFVGGMVRDRLSGRPSKDIDIEIHGITPETLRGILESLGNVTSMGASFGILGLQHYDIDIAMPRKEHATGRGHKDFEVYVDPFLGPEKAALRRDFTMNAMMEDVLTGEVLDFFGGQKDMERGVLRHVNDQTFAEDPLRVLRAAQFAARFGYQVAEETVSLAKRMDLAALPRERIWGELEKAFVKAPHPSIFFEQLRRMEQLHGWFAELEALQGVAQDPRHHPEGDVWNHTMLVLDQAGALCPAGEEKASGHRRCAFLTAALVHDFGKAVTTCAGEDGAVHSYRHETEGLPLAEAFIRRLNNENELLRYALNMTRLHMRPNMYYLDKARRNACMRLLDESVCPEDLLLLAKADWLGRGDPPPYGPAEEYWREQLAHFHERMARPHVQGRDLIDAGFAPGPQFKEALAYAHRLRLAGVKKEAALEQTVTWLQKREMR